MSSVCYKSLKDSVLKNYIRIHMLLEISQLEIPKVLALLGRLRTSGRQGYALLEVIHWNLSYETPFGRPPLYMTTLI